MQAVPIDEGFIDYAAFLGSLQAGGFDGSVAYEVCSPSPAVAEWKIWTPTPAGLWAFNGWFAVALSTEPEVSIRRLKIIAPE